MTVSPSEPPNSSAPVPTSDPARVPQRRARSRSSFEQKRLRFATISAEITALVGVVLGWVNFNEQDAVRWFYFASGDEVAVAAVATLTAFVVTLGVSMIGYRLYSHERDDLSELERVIERGRRYLIGRVTVSLVLSVAAGMAVMMGFWLVEQMFHESRITVLAAVAIMGVFAAVLGFAVGYTVSGIGESQLFLMIALTLGVGLMISFLIAQEPLWWENSISFLGHDPGSGIFFNLTVISVGLITLALARDLLDDLYLMTAANAFPRRGFQVLRLGLILVGLGIVGVGLFPTTITRLSNDLHNLSAHGMALTVVAGMFLIGRIAPDVYPRSFITLSLGLGLACVMSILLHFAFNAINFVVLELILFALFGVWIFLFQRYTKDYMHQYDAAEIVEIARQNDPDFLPPMPEAANV